MSADAEFEKRKMKNRWTVTSIFFAVATFAENTKVCYDFYLHFKRLQFFNYSLY